MAVKYRLPDEAWAQLIIAAEKDRVYLEGNILKFLDPGNSRSHKNYLEAALNADRSKREKRSEVTSRVQKQQKELEKALSEAQEANLETKQAHLDAVAHQEEAEKARAEAEAAKVQVEDALLKAERAKEEVERDLDYMQKTTQFELMGNIVRVALYVIVGVGVTTTALYAVALFGPKTAAEDTTLLANTWSNMFGILLTNSFSIIGTIMGVKYATERHE